MSDVIDSTAFSPADESLSTAPIEATDPDRDELGAARGLLCGIVLALPFWAFVAYLIW